MKEVSRGRCFPSFLCFVIILVVRCRSMENSLSHLWSFGGLVCGMIIEMLLACAQSFIIKGIRHQIDPWCGRWWTFYYECYAMLKLLSSEQNWIILPSVILFFLGCLRQNSGFQFPKRRSFVHEKTFEMF